MVRIISVSFIRVIIRIFPANMARGGIPARDKRLIIKIICG
jgi:hypothetical protein